MHVGQLHKKALTVRKGLELIHIVSELYIEVFLGQFTPQGGYSKYT